MNTAVYYPHLYPTPEWLKLAALCWDRVYRIKPPGVPEDPAPIRELDEALGGILDSVDLVAVATSPEILQQFEDWIDARAEKLKAEKWSSDEETLAALFPSKFPKGDLAKLLYERGLARLEDKRFEIQIPEWEQEAFRRRHFEAFTAYTPPPPGSAHAEYNRLTRDASDRRRAGDLDGANALEMKAEEIRQQNLVTVTDREHVVYLPKDIALHYLSLCASTAAAEGNRDLVSDGERFTDIVFHNARVLTGEVATSVLQAYLPEKLSTLPPLRIAEFRSELAVQRLKYQKEIQSLVDEFAAVASEEQLGHLRERIMAIANERVEETKKAYHHAKIDTVIKTFGISLTPPAIATTLASALGIGIFAPAGIAASVSIFAAKSFMELARARSQRAKSPWSYVFDVAKLS